MLAAEQVGDLRKKHEKEDEGIPGILDGDGSAPPRKEESLARTSENKQMIEWEAKTNVHIYTCR